MTIKEYADKIKERFRDNKTLKEANMTVAWFLDRLIEEADQMVRERQVKTGKQTMEILYELNEKYKKISKAVGIVNKKSLNPSGWKKFVWLRWRIVLFDESFKFNGIKKPLQFRNPKISIKTKIIKGDEYGEVGKN